jgi:fibronectin type 3 domain-containing protein
LRALIKTATVQVSDGQIDLEFLHGAADNPFIDAIEIIQTAAADSVAPTVPTALSAVPSSPTRIDLRWIASTDDVGVTGYVLERCQGAGCTNFVEYGTSTSATYSDTSLSASTTYRYRLRAIDASHNFSAYSNVAAGTTPAIADTQPPSAPQSARATTLSPTQVRVRWSPSADNVGVTGYLVERCSGAVCSDFVQIATSAVTTHTDTTVHAGTIYSYRVRATDAMSNLSGYSNTTSASTPVEDTQPPSTPGTPGATAASSNEVDLVWPASSDDIGVAGYLIERCQGAGCTDFSQVAAVGTNHYSDSGLSGGTIYRYRVRARDAVGNTGGYSPSVSVSTIAGTGAAGATTLQYDSFGRLKSITVTPQ